MKIIVIGAGSVGIGVAATLSIGGADITIVARGQAVEALRGMAIRISSVLGDSTINSGNFSVVDERSLGSCYDNGSQFKRLILNCDVVIVATKAYAVTSSLQSIIPIIKESSNPPLFLLLQNGWGSAEEAKQQLPARTAIFCGRVISGFERRSFTHVNITIHGDAVRIGSLFGDDPAKIQSLIVLAQNGFLPFEYESRIAIVLLQKLLYNICLNPLGALMQCTYGELIANKYTEALMHDIANEAIVAINASRCLNLYPSGFDYVRHDLIPKRIPKTAAHRSSMLQDIIAGRKTEIDYLNGAISKSALSMVF